MHPKRLRTQLAALNVAKEPRDLGVPGWRLHPLAGDLRDHWSLTVSGNWRLTFAFDGEDVVLVDYLDYQDRKSTRLNSSHVKISYAVFCLKKKKKRHKTTTTTKQPTP